MVSYISQPGAFEKALQKLDLRQHTDSVARAAGCAALSFLADVVNLNPVSNWARDARISVNLSLGLLPFYNG